MKGAQLWDVDFKGADLTGAVLDKDFDSSILRSAIRNDVKYDTVVDIEAIANLHRLWLESATKQGQAARFDKADLQGKDFSSKRLAAASFFGACLLSARFAEAALMRCDFTGADLRQAAFHKADLRGAVFVDARMMEVDLRGADLSPLLKVGAAQATVVANLRGANLVAAKLTGANLKQACLSGADLSRADLTDAVLDGADLRNAILDGATIGGATMAGADLRGVEGLAA